MGLGTWFAGAGACAVVLIAWLALHGAGQAQTVSPSISPASIEVDTPVGQGQRIDLVPFAVRNESPEPATVQVSAQPVAGSELSADPDWFDLTPGTFDLDGQSGQAVDVTLAVPASATPGEYRALLRAEFQAPDSGEGIAVALRTAVASEVRFTVVEHTVTAADPFTAMWDRYRWSVLLMLGSGIVTFVVLFYRDRARRARP